MTRGCAAWLVLCAGLVISSAFGAGCDGVGTEPAPAPTRSVARSLRAVVRPQPPKTAAPCDPGLRCQHIHRWLEPRQAPALSQPPVVSARGGHGLREADRVVGVWIGDTARAYPLNVLAYHRVINDRLAGRALVVAHSPLSGATLCAARPAGGAELAASGTVYEGDTLLAARRVVEKADRHDAAVDLWSVLLARGVLGRVAGRNLEPLPCAVMSWSAWRRLHPRGGVSWPHRAVLGFDYRRDPWAWYRAADKHLVTPVHYLDLRAARKQAVVGVAQGGFARAFALRREDRRVVNALVGDAPVAVVLHGPSGHGLAFSRRLPGRDGALTFRLEQPSGRSTLPLLIDEQTQSRWTLLGRAIGGPLAGEQLVPVSRPALYAFAWAAFYPTSQDRNALDRS